MTSMLYPPYIIERSSRGERTYDIFSRLLMDRSTSWSRLAFWSDA